jgi:chromosome segregation ATPase
MDFSRAQRAARDDAILRMEDRTPPLNDAESHSLRSAAALRDLEERARAALTANREHVARLEEDIARQFEELAATLKEQTAADLAEAAEVDRTRQEAERAREECRRLHAELESAQATWAGERSTLEAERDRLTTQVAALEAQQRAVKEQWQQQLAEFERKLGEHQSAWSEQRAAWNEERESSVGERDELRQKFELALEDVQRFRGRVAELEQELARRPEASEADSAELVALRAERDALCERVEQLEREPAAQIDASSEQQMADLQRRFELAVEDVRELKTRNAKLESQLASAEKRPAKPVDASGMDWESQKLRLLASLEDSGDEPHDPARREERLTIENTIEMTDAIVAEKDKEIAELKSQLAAGGDSSARMDAERDQKIEAMLDTDEVIAEHRKRIAQLEREIEEKLRAAELELSVERAKIARQKAELEDLRADLEARRNELGEHGAGSASGMPRRRWLSKLGLSGEEQ